MPRPHNREEQQIELVAEPWKLLSEFGTSAVVHLRRRPPSPSSTFAVVHLRILIHRTGTARLFVIVNALMVLHAIEECVVLAFLWAL
ncbi:hypothetical protein VNO78_06692 [Psophocarpus tetragonolobus]|uniref:Uncharacterized protein n=1 Tax=Psophocarpus tetragonolobus TaxID=3891 RepID=A0AAN9XRJ6_PSOTE